MKLKTPEIPFRLAFSLLLVSFLSPVILNAEIIKLKNGNAIETKILKEDESFVIVQAPNGKVKIPKRDIQLIWRGTSGELLSVQGNQVFFDKGMELYKRGQFQEAAEAFEKALGPRVVNPIIYANIGSAYASVGEIKKAEENFLAALEGKFNNPDVLLNLAHLYEVSKNYKTAATYYQKVVTLQRDNFDAKRSLAYCLYMSENFLGAAKLFEELGKRNDPVAVCNAAAAYIQAGELDQAFSLLDDMIGNPFPVPRAYLLMAEISRLRKDHAGAEKYYKEALKKDPDAEKVKIALGWLYFDMEEWSKAEAVFNEALAEDPGSLGAIRGLAKVFVQKGEFQKAISQYEKLAEKDPNDPAIASIMGTVYLKMSQPTQALEMFQKTLARNDGDAKAHSNAGLAYALMDNADKALEEWRRALDLDPKLEAAAKNKKILEEAMQGNKNEKTAPQ